MAEPEKKEASQGAQAVAAAGFDPAVLQVQINEAVQAGIAAAAAKATVSAPEPRPASTATPKTDPILEAIAPSIAPYLTQARIDALGANDAAVFYATTPAAHKHSDAIEKLYNDAVAAGRPIARSALWNYYKGAHFQQFMKEELEAKAEAERRAELASTVGVGAPRTADLGPSKDPHDMASDELDAYLADKAF